MEVLEICDYCLLWKFGVNTVALRRDCIEAFIGWLVSFWYLLVHSRFETKNYMILSYY